MGYGVHQSRVRTKSSCDTASHSRARQRNHVLVVLPESFDQPARLVVENVVLLAHRHHNWLKEWEVPVIDGWEEMVLDLQVKSACVFHPNARVGWSTEAVHSRKFNIHSEIDTGRTKPADCRIVFITSTVYKPVKKKFAHPKISRPPKLCPVMTWCL